MGFLFVGSVGIVPQWFLKRRSLANGFAAGGSGLGGLVYSLAAQKMIATIGLPWAFRVLAIVCGTVLAISSILIRDRNKHVGSSLRMFDHKLLNNVGFLLTLAWGVFSMLGYVILVFSVSAYASSIGLTPQQGSVVSALLNLSQALGRPIIGQFSDRMGRINIAGLLTAVCSLWCFAVWIPATSYGVLLLFVLLSGAVAGTFWATVAPVAVEVLGLVDLPSGLTITWLVLVIPCTC